MVKLFRIRIAILLALMCPAFAATSTLRISTSSTLNTTSYASGSFTPAASELLIGYVSASGTVAADATLTDTQSLGFTLVVTAAKNSSADTLYLFVANNLATNTSMTVTFNCTSDAATGAIVDVVGVSGPTRVGSSAIRQSAIKALGGISGTPATTFGSAALTANTVLSAVFNATSPAGVTVPSTWTSLDSTSGYSTPTSGMDVAAKDTGFTSTTVTWGGTSATSFSAISAEIDTSAPPACPHTLSLLGAGCS